MNKFRKGKKLKFKGHTDVTDEIIKQINANPEIYGIKANECLMSKSNPEYN